jgi:hypothetical protein
VERRRVPKRAVVERRIVFFIKWIDEPSADFTKLTSMSIYFFDFLVFSQGVWLEALKAV